MTVYISGPLPTIPRGNARLSRLLSLHYWLQSTCHTQSHNISYVSNFFLFWSRPSFYMPDGLHPNKYGTQMLSLNLRRAVDSQLKPLESEWLLFTASDPHVESVYIPDLTTSGSLLHSRPTATCCTHSTGGSTWWPPRPITSTTYHIPTIISIRQYFQHPIRTVTASNLTAIPLQPITIPSVPTLFASQIKIALLNIRSLNLKSNICNTFITSNQIDILVLTETWLKSNDFDLLNAASPPLILIYRTPGFLAAKGAA